MAELAIGLLGAGHFGRFHALKVAASGRAKLAGICDPNTERAQAVAWEAGTQVLSQAALLAASDAVIIAAPADFHFELAGAALRAGKHVLVEKPIAATLDQAAQLAELSRAKGLVLQVGHLERFSAAHGAVTSRMGKPLYIEAVRIAPFKPRVQVPLASLGDWQVGKLRLAAVEQAALRLVVDTGHRAGREHKAPQATSPLDW